MSKVAIQYLSPELRKWKKEFGLKSVEFDEVRCCSWSACRTLEESVSAATMHAQLAIVQRRGLCEHISLKALQNQKLNKRSVNV